MPIERREITDRTTWLEWRKEDLTASTAAALFGDDLHPHVSAYQLWAQKSGLVTKPSLIDPKLARRGDVIEKISPQIIGEERPEWGVYHNLNYYRDPEARIGATPDLMALRPDIEGTGVIQVKSVGQQAFRQWQDRDTGETALPMWIAIQVSIEAAMAEANWAAVTAITIGDSGLDVEIIDVPLMPALMDKFRLLAQDFWRRVAEKDPYDIDWGKDAATVLDIYRDDNGGVTDLAANERIGPLLDMREGLKRIEDDGNAATKARKPVDAEIISILGNYAKGRLLDGRLVEAKTVRRKAYNVEATSYRAVKVKP
jgi:hypothetical protein